MPEGITYGCSNADFVNSLASDAPETKARKMISAAQIAGDRQRNSKEIMTLGTRQTAETDYPGHEKSTTQKNCDTEALKSISKQLMTDGSKKEEKFADPGPASATMSLRDEFRINKKLLPVKLATFCFHGGRYSQ